MKRKLSATALIFTLSLPSFAACIGPRDVGGLITQTYILAAVVAIVFILLAVLTANLIKFQGGTNPKDPGKRRIWFWLLAALTPIVFLVYNLVLVVPELCPGKAANEFTMHPFIGTAVALVLYVVIGFALSKSMSRSKMGNWFPSK